MNISRIFLTNFRNIEKKEIVFSDKVLVKGINGTGKTSLIEACYILLNGRSFKTSDLKECIKKETKNFFIKCDVSDFQSFSREISIGYDVENNRRILVDSNSSSRKELMKIVYPVLHCPENMEIISGGPKSRRDFIDRICFMEEGNYFDDMTEYLRFLKNKNAALKKGSVKTVDYLNQAAVPLIEKIRAKRKNACIILNENMKKVTADFFPDGGVVFNPYTEENTLEKISLKLEKELSKGFALYGPHLDPLNIQTYTGNSKNSISMGQTYLFSFLLKLAEISIYAQKNIYPVFFIDDLFVFLDKNTKNKLYELLIMLKNQVIMTSSTENPDNFLQITSVKMEKQEI
jgi:DNA replication and repair protein RecF